MKRVGLVVVFVLTIGGANARSVDIMVAQPVTFKCTTAKGQPAADLVIDVDNRTLSWGGQKYAIRATDDRYISAYLENHGEVGGEVWVFNRVTGEYVRASVYIGHDSPDAISKNEPGKLTAATFRGKCSRPLL